MDSQTRLRPSSNVPQNVADAAKSVAVAGGSPRAQIDAARQVSGKKLCYLPHIGSRQKLRSLERMAKAAAKATN